MTTEVFFGKVISCRKH